MELCLDLLERLFGWNAWVNVFFMTPALGRINLESNSVYTSLWSLRPVSTEPDSFMKAGVLVNITSRQDALFIDILVGVLISESRS